MSRLFRRVLCAIGLHRWQLLYEPPHVRGERYKKAVYCIACSREAPWRPGEFRP